MSANNDDPQPRDRARDWPVSVDLIAVDNLIPSLGLICGQCEAEIWSVPLMEHDPHRFAFGDVHAAVRLHIAELHPDGGRL